jgi:transposase-like protein
MQDSSTSPGSVLQFRQDLQATLRDRVRRAIETVLEEELMAALGAETHARTPGRRGYRHGAVTRTLTTRAGTRMITVPRARLETADGGTEEFRSTVVPRYARRTREVDEALLGCYFGGVNSRRIRRALKPLFGDAHLSKSAVSRVVARVKAQFLAWQQRPLAEERYAVLFLDGFHLRVRLAGRVVTVPVLAALGVTETGQKQLVALQLATAEAATSWGGLLGDLPRRGLPAPLLVVTDGHAGLKKALDAWPTVRVQRCTTHKGRNLEDACPVHARPELRRDYHRLLYAADGLAARKAYDELVKKWSALCPPVVRSLEEAGHDLLTFYSFPKAMWKSLRTTNALENLNREFRRRTKTQASFSTEGAALTVLFGLVAVGQIVFRKIDGHQELAAFLNKEQWSHAA